MVAAVTIWPGREMDARAITAALDGIDLVERPDVMHVTDMLP